MFPFHCYSADFRRSVFSINSVFSGHQSLYLFMSIWALLGHASVSKASFHKMFDHLLCFKKKKVLISDALTTLLKDFFSSNGTLINLRTNYDIHEDITY